MVVHFCIYSLISRDRDHRALAFVFQSKGAVESMSNQHISTLQLLEPKYVPGKFISILAGGRNFQRGVPHPAVRLEIDCN